jgi:CRP/FNR family transcriptional regulator, dissimilatory nitrate respiration regulator
MQSYVAGQLSSLIWIKGTGIFMNVIDILHDCVLFSEVQPSGFRRLATIARLCHFRKDQAIFRENDPCPGMYVLGQGLVRVFKKGSGGKEHVLHIVGPGETFAEVAAIGGFSVPASAQAIQRSACVLLPLEGFQKSLAEDHELCLGMMAGMALWVRRLVTSLEDIALRDAAGRVARYLLDLPLSRSKLNAKREAKGTVPFSQARKLGQSPVDTKIGTVPDRTVLLPGLKRYVASHLNLTSETFSRTLRRLVEAGLIAEEDNGRVRLLHPKKLLQVAEGLFPKL